MLCLIQFSLNNRGFYFKLQPLQTYMFSAKDFHTHFSNRDELVKEHGLTKVTF